MKTLIFSTYENPNNYGDEWNICLLDDANNIIENTSYCEYFENELKAKLYNIANRLLNEYYYRSKESFEDIFSDLHRKEGIDRIIECHYGSICIYDYKDEKIIMNEYLT